MKIAYVYPHFKHLAGTERVLIEKMNYLADKAGMDVMMVTYDQSPHPIVYPLSSKLKHIDLDIRFYSLYQHNRFVRLLKWPKYRRSLMKRFNQLMEDTKPDIVVTTTYHGRIMVMIDNCPTHFVKVLESHIDKRYLNNHDPVNHRNWITRIRSIYDMMVLNCKASKFDVLVALNSNDAKEWSHYLKTRVIKNIVHLNNKGRYSNLESKRAIFVGRYYHQKGIPDLVRIWKIVHKRHPDWHLDMYGDGDFIEIPATEEERLQMNIHAHGADSDIFERYLESSFLLITSLYEPFGLVMPEAMSCGLPVVAFDCPSGPAQIITDGVDGFLIKNRDVELFVDKVCSLIESSELRHAMGKAAIESSQRYSTDHIMAQWINLFKELMASSQS